MRESDARPKRAAQDVTAPNPVLNPATATHDHKFLRDALEDHKRLGVELAVQARWVFLPVVAVFLIVVHPVWSQLYYVTLLAVLCVNGWFIRTFARVGRSRVEVALIMFDLILMTIGMIAPNPFEAQGLPVPMMYDFGNFIYFFIILSAGTLAYSWRTVMAIGVWTSVIWLAGALVASWLSTPNVALGHAIESAVAQWPGVFDLIDPNDIGFRFRIQEAMVFLMVAATLALSTRRFYRMLESHAHLGRERANLSRYFSPNVVEQLSHNDEPLKQVRTADVAVLFIDIIGFTRLSAEQDAVGVIEMLRGFHGRMENEVFHHGGTLDKYLGDGLMATFGTPMPGPLDATNALRCAGAMCRALDAWNTERTGAGMAEISVGIGIHYGEIVQGDIGANRLEYAVIGTAVNVAARLEAMTRSLGQRIAISDDLYRRILAERDATNILAPFIQHQSQDIRGLDRPMTLWTADRA